MNNIEFKPFPKIARLSREIVITEKIDGTNAQIYITDEGDFLVGSRSRWLSEQQDNFGFYKWAKAHEEELRQLGPGQHFGEWWGSGIQRGYGLTNGEKRFSLFNTRRWIDKAEPYPSCCSVVPVLYRGNFNTDAINHHLANLQFAGSAAAPGFMNPEGIIIYHAASGAVFKKTIEGDDQPKGK